jgi:hypothetical protein
MDDRLELIWREAVRAVELQSKLLVEVRARAVGVLTAAAIIMSFLGARALDDATGGGWSIAGFICFLLVVAASAFVLTERKVYLVQSAKVLIDENLTKPPFNDADQLRWLMSAHLCELYDRNRRKLTWMQHAVSMACVATGAEVVAWFIELQN